jgi:hypothetical protein
MNLALLIIPLGLLLMMALVAAVRSQAAPITSLDDFQRRWKSVDLPALANVIDAEEEVYLRENLSRSDFKMIRRKRLAVSWEYLSRLGANARLMVRAGQAIQHSAHGEQSLEARALVADSMRLRNAVFMAQVSIAARFVFPELHSPIASALEQYSSMRESIERAFAERQIHAVVKLG